MRSLPRQIRGSARKRLRSSVVISARSPVLRCVFQRGIARHAGQLCDELPGISRSRIHAIQQVECQIQIVAQRGMCWRLCALYCGAQPEKDRGQHLRKLRPRAEGFGQEAVGPGKKRVFFPVWVARGGDD